MVFVNMRRSNYKRLVSSSSIAIIIYLNFKLKKILSIRHVVVDVIVTGSRDVYY